MLFLAKWRMHPGKAREAYKLFAQLPAGHTVRDGGEKVKLVGRWHDVGGGTGALVAECDDPRTIALWALNWTSIMEFETTPVFTDEDAVAIGRSVAD